MEQKIIIVPALNPNTTFISWLEELLEHSFKQVIIINDGSTLAHTNVFNKVSHFDRVTVLNHKKNEGKGRAIKTGLSFILKTYKQFDGVITAGADGQHDVEDIVRLCNSTRIFKEGIIIGVRDFKSEYMPKHSFLTNRVVTILFDLLFKRWLVDIQSGLRYFPKQHVGWLKNVRGDGFNYDMNVLIEGIKRDIPLYEIPIGKARMTQNVFLQYDGVYHPKLLSKHLLQAFKRYK